MTRLLVRIGLVTLVLTTTPLDVAAQPFVCNSVKRGDTASTVARRFTGRADSHHQPWFRIVDRAKSRMVPKSAYNRILTGWQVCIPATRVTRQVSESRPTGTTGQSDARAPLVTSQAIPAQRLIPRAGASDDSALELAFMFLAPALFGGVIGLGWYRVERFLTGRRSLKREVQDFGIRFVNDFERPLVIDGFVSRPIRARLRWVWHRRRLDILLAPAAGRRYPNLDDHRRNVEYDVDRIAYRLRHRPFVRRPLRGEGPWVVVPFQLKSRLTGDRV